MGDKLKIYQINYNITNIEALLNDMKTIEVDADAEIPLRVDFFKKSNIYVKKEIMDTLAPEKGKEAKIALSKSKNKLKNTENKLKKEDYEEASRNDTLYMEEDVKDETKKKLKRKKLGTS